MTKRLWISIVSTLLLIYSSGCGAPQYAKMSMELNPRTGEVRYWSTQETAIVLGQIEAGVDASGQKTLKVGTATQPAFSYGSQGVPVMDAYARQQAQYTIMLDTVGKNLIGQIDAIGNAAGTVLGGLAGLRQSAVSSGGANAASACATIDGLQARVDAIVSQLNGLRTLANGMQAQAAVR